MKIHCPFCRSPLTIKGVEPGGYRRPCPRCREPFVLVLAVVDGRPLVLTGRTLESVRPASFEAAPAADEPTQVTPAGDMAAPGGQGPAALHAAAPGPSAVPQAVGAADETAEPAGPGGEPATIVKAAAGPAIPAVAGAGRAAAASRAGGEGAGRSLQTRTHPVAPGRALTARLDGYELIRRIGRGGMGWVYLARQISLDRQVALKTISPEWVDDPVVLARFTREAFAAAQLSHHNVVQIHDMGEADGTHYFTMEYVEGPSLAQVLQEKGRLDAEEAACYILHAARGLRVAHAHDMIHRDVKPANLLLAPEGMVKVADLGLVKQGRQVEPRADEADEAGRAERERSGRAGGSLTSSAAMGTPAYMAPEQIRNPAAIDVRADIYSLGCTFYALTTGRPVFEGGTAEEVMTKHATEAVVSPDRIADRVPPTVCSIIMNMVAKRPADRFESMKAVVEALEHFLGIAAGPFTPQEDHRRTLEQAAQGFHVSAAAKLRRWVIVGFAAACVVGAAVGLLRGPIIWTAAAAGLWAAATLSYGVLVALTQRTVLGPRLRQLIFESTLADLLTATLAVIATVIALIALDLHWPVLALLAAGAALAAAMRLSLDRWVGRERAPHIERVSRMLKQLRLRGLEEDSIRRFVCRYSGRQWEAFYEALFGYEAKLFARRHWGFDDNRRMRPRYGAWRERVVDWIDARQQRRAELRHRKHLRKVEAARLRSEGKAEAEADREARAVAETLISRASDYRRTGRWQGMRDTTAGAQAILSDQRGELIRWLTYVFFDSRARFVAGLVMLAIYGIWGWQHALIERWRVEPTVAHARQMLNREFPPLEIGRVPPEIMQPLSSHAAGLAGLMLLLSAFYGERRVTLYMVPAVGVLLFGFMLPVPQIGGLFPAELVLLTGLALGVVGWALGREY